MPLTLILSPDFEKLPATPCIFYARNHAFCGSSSRMMLSLLVLLLVVPRLAITGNIPSGAHVSMTSPGDVLLGASLPIHDWSSGPPCSGGVYDWGIELSAILLFAIEEINNRTDLLPNITLGYDIRDNCYSEILAIWTALTLASTSERPQQDVQFTKISPAEYGNLLCIIGTQTSSTTIPTAQTASLYHIPVISPFATSNELSDKSRFPYFLRTVPADSLQATAIADILLRFGWHYVGLYFQMNSYGIHGAQSFLRLADKHNICVAFSVSVQSEAKDSKLREAVDKLSQFPKARVIVMLMDVVTASGILTTIRNDGSLPHITFVGSDAWALPETLARYNVDLAMLQGSLFVQQQFTDIPGFDFDQLLQTIDLDHPWLTEWKTERNCSDLTECQFPISANDHPVVDAVYAFSYALHDMLYDRCANDTECRWIISHTISGQEFFPHLLNATFEGLAGEFKFDTNGDPGGSYKILNFQIHKGTFAEVNVGQWSSSAKNSLRLNTSALQWYGETTDAPVSLCREICQLGFVEVPLEEKCCYGCHKCDPGSIVSGTSCLSCTKDEWPDESFSHCYVIVPTPPSWNEPTVITILVVSGLGLVLSLLTAIGLFHHRHHVLIKAASRELSGINILGLTLAFLVPVTFLAPVTESSCRASEIIVSLCFTLTYAPTLLKVNRIYRIFDAGKKSNKRPRFIGPRTQLGFALIAAQLMMVICIFGTLLSPTVPAKLYFSPRRGYIEAFCAFGYGALVSTSFNMLLVLACCFYAFKARKVPSNYNESKFIAISVYSTLVFGLAAVPVYITATTVLQKVATLCVAILLNSFLTLFCVYLPKLYAIRFAVDVRLCEWKSNAAVSADNSLPSSSEAQRRSILTTVN